MLLVSFRYKLNPDSRDDYLKWSARMGELARQVPGYRSHKTFEADDGERATLVEFESEEGMRIWASHPEHVQAKRLGRSSFFLGYRVSTCQVLRESSFPAAG